MSLDGQRQDLINAVNEAFDDAESTIEKGVDKVYDFLWDRDDDRELFENGELDETTISYLVDRIDTLRDNSVDEAYREASNYHDVNIDTDDLFDYFNGRLEQALSDLDWDDLMEHIPR